MQLQGMHHLTAVSADAPANHTFYTRVLGMRLIKKTVNQDDVRAYHLFYGDGLATPGSDITFFDWPVPKERRGTNSITRSSLRVSGEGTLRWWRQRLGEHGMDTGDIVERAGRKALDFDDPEGQRLSLVDDGGGGDANPWAPSPVPAERQIRGLGPAVLTVTDRAAADAVLREVMQMQEAGRYPDPGSPEHAITVYSMGRGGPAAEVHLSERTDLPQCRQGAGAVHHVAFRTPDVEQYQAWNARLRQMRIASSGPVDRYYFKSLYFREPNGILFEIATDGPGFDADEPMAKLGERLALPPFLEGRRAAIEANLKPL